MKLGIKVGFQKSSISDLEATKSSFCEVWFDINRADAYTQLFTNVTHHHIETGLHFWGTLPDGTWTNIAYPDTSLNNASIALMKQTVDIAAKNSFAYVNIHPGSSAKLYLDLYKEKITILSAPKPLEESIQNFIKNLTLLDQYAKKQGVVLTVETVPVRVMNEWNQSSSRLHPKHAYELPNQAILLAAHKSMWVANDFGHTAANCISDSAGTVWNYLLDISRQLVPQTRLIHLGFLSEPFNGTDFHDSFDNPVFETSHAVPNKFQMDELLKLFSNRNDIWVLTEPKNDHVKNYFLAKKILQTAGVFDK